MSRRKEGRERERRGAGSAERPEGNVGASEEQPHRLARQVMWAAPGSVAPGDSLARAARLMDSLGTREIPVVDDRVLVGILTRTDMEAFRGHFEWTAVRSAMTPDPVTVPPDAPIAAVVNLFLDRGFNGLPVSSGGELLGMIRRTDVLRALAPRG
jgi:CBS domain-containing protein